MPGRRSRIRGRTCRGEESPVREKRVQGSRAVLRRGAAPRAVEPQVGFPAPGRALYAVAARVWGSQACRFSVLAFAVEGLPASTARASALPVSAAEADAPAEAWSACGAPMAFRVWVSPVLELPVGKGKASEYTVSESLDRNSWRRREPRPTEHQPGRAKIIPLRRLRAPHGAGVLASERGTGESSPLHSSGARCSLFPVPYPNGTAISVPRFLHCSRRKEALRIPRPISCCCSSTDSAMRSRLKAGHLASSFLRIARP
jgi:hypothetical protein